jgi:hypothetical protein
VIRPQAPSSSPGSHPRSSLTGKRLTGNCENSIALIQTQTRLVMLGRKAAVVLFQLPARFTKGHGSTLSCICCQAVTGTRSSPGTGAGTRRRARPPARPRCGAVPLGPCGLRRPARSRLPAMPVCEGMGLAGAIAAVILERRCTAGPTHRRLAGGAAGSRLFPQRPQGCRA